MSNEARNDVIANWVGDYCTSTAFRDHPSLLREYAPEVLTTFLSAACDQRDVEPAEIEEPDLKPALLEHVARIEMAGSARPGVPELCGSFLSAMQDQGRLSGGHTMGLYVKALRQPYLDAAQGRGQTIRGPETKLGRNDPCPCGSGKKYKKCCMNLG